ncbi:MAG: hypothetical protein KF775_18660 [Cyclobacteriaceae bacterium]|nr:hypothetical protein [Cyclobacteriaceae bacterium]
MKNTIILSILLLIFIFNTEAQKSAEVISIGEKVTFFSKTLNEERRIWIYVPDQTSFQKKIEKRYPVLYLLDGESQFYSTVGLVQQLSQANLNSILPEMIIVGIENTNRYRDLTPKVNSTPFITFLEKELFQYVDEKYRTAPYKLLVGHSLGGLLTIDILTNKPEMFNAYIAIDPSMWYADEQFLNQTISQLPKQKLTDRKLFVGIANSLPPNVTLKNVSKDKSSETRHIRSILKLGDFFSKQPNKGIQYKQNFYENENHNSAPLLTQYDGLRFVFDFYQSDLSEKDFQDSTSLIVTKLRNHYQKVSKGLGYSVAPEEEFINYIAYDALGKKHFSKAKSLFILNLENFPQSNKTHAAYADYLAATGDIANATEFYEKSLQIKDDKAVQQRLLTLTSKGMTLTESDLIQYVGQYVLDDYKITIVLELKDGKLISKVPGQADSEFVPVSKDVFTVKDKQGYNITFHKTNDTITGFTSVQPNGIFKATKKS